MTLIKLPLGKCNECADNKLKPVIGKREKALCVTHYQQKARAAAGPISNKSDRREDEDKIYFAVRKIFLAENKLCVCGLPGCLKKASDIHHTKGRGIYYLEVYTWVPACRPCHDLAGEKVTMAKEVKLSQDRLTKHKVELPFNLNIENSLLKLKELQWDT